MSSITVTKSFDFSVSIVKFCFEVQKKKHEYIITKQLLRSATSIAANIEEAQGAFSKRDFIYKLQISLKEARETYYWLRLIKSAQIFEEYNVDEYLVKSNELIILLTRILKTSKEKLNKDN